MTSNAIPAATSSSSGTFPDDPDGTLDLGEELSLQTLGLPRIPAPSFGEVELRLGADAERASHFRGLILSRTYGQGEPASGSRE